MRDIVEATAPHSLQYSVGSFDNYDEIRISAHQLGVQAIDRAADRTLTPIYFSSYSTGSVIENGAPKSSQNYYQIKNNFGKI